VAESSTCGSPRYCTLLLCHRRFRSSLTSLSCLGQRCQRILRIFFVFHLWTQNKGRTTPSTHILNIVRYLCFIFFLERPYLCIPTNYGRFFFPHPRCLIPYPFRLPTPTPTHHPFPSLTCSALDVGAPFLLNHILLENCSVVPSFPLSTSA
jgi:hypothetical protein